LTLPEFTASESICSKKPSTEEGLANVSQSMVPSLIASASQAD
jgi:hypothetical protein